MDLGPNFLGNLILLALTALVSGICIPMILKRYEAGLARQTRLIEAQSRLLDELTAVLWKWRYLAKQVSYYGVKFDLHPEAYQRACRKYEDDVWQTLNEFRTLISRSRRLASEAAYVSLEALYQYIVRDLDLKVRALASAEPPDANLAYAIAERFSKEVSAKLDEALDALATELKLKASL